MHCRPTLRATATEKSGVSKEMHDLVGMGIEFFQQCRIDTRSRPHLGALSHIVKINRQARARGFMEKGGYIVHLTRLRTESQAARQSAQTSDVNPDGLSSR